MTTRGVYRPTTCPFGESFYTDTRWLDGQLEYVDELCEQCRDGVLL